MGLLDSVLGAISRRVTGNALLDSVLSMADNPQTGAPGQLPGSLKGRIG